MKSTTAFPELSTELGTGSLLTPRGMIAILPVMDTDAPEISTGEIAQKLVRTAAQIADPFIRRHFFVRRLEPLPDATVVEVLHRIQVSALQGDPDSQAAATTGIDGGLLIEEFGRLRIGRLYHEAARKKYQAVCNLFRVIRPAKTPDGDEDAFYQYGLTTLTVGERTSAARSFNVDLLFRVGYDVDPRVIRQLLQNPRMTEKLVVDIAARRPNRAPVLTEIYHSDKWRARPQVRVALVRNPYTPPQIALALLPTLMRQELREVLFDGGLHPEVREAAESAMQTKGGAAED
jgi:hypothetical protein